MRHNPDNMIQLNNNKILLNIDDVISIKEVGEKLEMHLSSVYRMRDTNPRKYRLLALGVYVEKYPLDILVTSISVVHVLDKRIAITKLLQEGIN